METAELDLGGLGGIDANSFMDFDKPGAEVVAEPEPATPASETASPKQETPAAGAEPQQQEDTQANLDDKLFVGIDPAVVELMKRTAKDYDVDLNDAKLFKMARQIAEKEQHIRSGRKADEPSAQAKDYLAAFRDPEPDKEQPAAAAAPKQEGQQPADDDSVPAYVKVARGWKTPADFYNSFTSAYEMEEGPEKQEAVANALMGLQDRHFVHNHLPAIVQRMERLIEERLGPVVQEARSTRSRQEREAVISKLKSDGLEDINELFDDASSGTIEFDGDQIPDTWLNRVLVQHPYILKITETGRTPAESQRLTTAAQYLAAHQVMKAMRAATIDPKAVSSAVDLGAAIEKSKRDPERTGLNKGTPGVPAGKDELDSIFGSSGNSLEKLLMGK